MSPSRADRDSTHLPLGPQFSRAILPSVLPSATHRNGAPLDAPLTRDSTPLSLDALASAPSPSEALSRLSPDQLAALAGRCAAIQSAIQLAIITRTAAPTDPGNGNGSARMLSADEACAVLQRPRRWLFAHAKRMPWIKRLSRKVILIRRSRNAALDRLAPLAPSDPPPSTTALCITDQNKPALRAL